ncbi:hypothetical protein [Guyparkeria sp.]|uniref:hypothetical protein n=1 Tax=Guyparkeria sp. TaxID=2035736 RepID=UPI00397056D9
MPALYANLLKRPAAVLRELDGTLSEWLQALGLLVLIILFNAVLTLWFRSGDFLGELMSAAQSAALFSVVLSISVLVTLRLVSSWSGTWFAAHTASIVIMLPLILGAVPVVGMLAVLASFVLVYRLVRDLSGQGAGRSVLLTVIVWSLIATVALIYTRAV